MQGVFLHSRKQVPTIWRPRDGTMIAGPNQPAWLTLERPDGSTAVMRNRQLQPIGIECECCCRCRQLDTRTLALRDAYSAACGEGAPPSLTRSDVIDPMPGFVGKNARNALRGSSYQAAVIAAAQKAAIDVGGQ